MDAQGSFFYVQTSMCKKGKICSGQKLKLTLTKLSNTSRVPLLNPLCKHFITLHKFVCVVVFVLILYA